jgi:hypothetical protein
VPTTLVRAAPAGPRPGHPNVGTVTRCDPDSGTRPSAFAILECLRDRAWPGAGEGWGKSGEGFSYRKQTFAGFLEGEIQKRGKNDTGILTS